MQENQTVDVNDEVVAVGQYGRFVVLEIEGTMAEVQLFGDHMKTGERIYFEKTKMPVSMLSVIGKDHKRPTTYRVFR